MDLMNDNISNDGDHQRSRVDDTNDLVSKKEAIVPSYDFQPIRPNATVGLSHSALDLAGSVNSTAARGFTASDFYPVKSSARVRFLLSVLLQLLCLALMESVIKVRIGSTLCGYLIVLIV